MWLTRLNVIIKRNFAKYLQTLSVCSLVSSDLKRMQEGFVEINSVPTHIFTYGQWIQVEFKKKELVLIITGNPGLPGFYTTFASTIFNELKEEIPVWVIGQAGHDEPKKELNMITPPLKGNEDIYNLKGQLDHKKEFINRFIPKDVNIYMIGHSIGSKMSLDLLKIPEFSNQIQSAYLMFPTIERMAESTKGRQVPTYDRFFFLFRIFYNFIAWLPKSWKLYLVRRYCEREKLPLEFHEPSLEYTNPPVIDKIWFLALDEMDKVRELDEKLLKENVNRVKLYYAVVDDWVPLDAYDSLKTKIPNIDAQVCTEGYEHAFVLKNGVEVGKIVSGWLNIKRQETQ